MNRVVLQAFFVSALFSMFLFISCGTTKTVTDTHTTDTSKEAEEATVSSQEEKTDTSAATTPGSGKEENTISNPTTIIEDKKAEVAEEEEFVSTEGQLTKVNSLKNATQAAGFSMEAPEEISTYTNRTVMVEKGYLIHLKYEDPSSTDNNISIKKAFGSIDISEDNTNYPDVVNMNDIGTQIVLKGRNGSYKTASWLSGDYTFCINSTEGLSQSEIISIIRNTN